MAAGYVASLAPNAFNRPKEMCLVKTLLDQVQSWVNLMSWASHCVLWCAEQHSVVCDTGGIPFFFHPSSVGALCLLSSPQPTPPPAVVLVLSEAFVSTPYPMEELQLLLEWRRQGSPTVLLPVFYGAECEEVGRRIVEYQAQTESRLKQQWAEDLREVSSITGARLNQVRALQQLLHGVSLHISSP
jgi:hypothetical protein